MATLKKISSGILYENDFNSGSLDNVWITTPSSSYLSLVDNPGFVRMISSPDKTTFFLINPGVPTYVFYAKIEYTPLDETTYAGIVVYSDVDNYVELRNYYNAENTGIRYPYLKVVKNYDIIYLYGSIDNIEWELLGTTWVYPDSIIGFYTKGIAPLDIDKVSIFKSESMYISNIIQGNKVEIYDTNNILLNTLIPNPFDIVEIKTQYNTSGYIKIIDENDEVIFTSDPISFIYGDEYRYNLETELYIENEETHEYELFTPALLSDLGMFYSDIIERRFKIKNIDTEIIDNIEVSIINNNTKAGHQFAKVSIYEQTHVVGYDKRFIVNNIEPNEEFYFILQIQRDLNGNIYHPDYGFIIRVRTW